jgi:hypothetical protein
MKATMAKGMVGVLVMGMILALHWESIVIYSRLLPFLHTAVPDMEFMYQPSLQFMKAHYSSNLFAVSLIDNQAAVPHWILTNDGTVSQSNVSSWTTIPAIWALNSPSNLDSNFNASEQSLQISTISAREVLSSILRKETASEHDHYISNIHLINIFSKDIVSSDSSVESSMSERLRDELQKQLHATTSLNLLNITVKSYDRLVPAVDYHNEDELLQVLENIINEIRQTFKEDNKYSQHDLFVYEFRDERFPSLQLYTGEKFSVSGKDAIDRKMNEYRSMILLHDNSNHSSESQHRKVASISRHIIRTYVFSYSLKDLFLLSTTSSLLPETFAEEVISSLTILDITAMEIYVEFLLRRQRIWVRVRHHLQELFTEYVAEPWKILSCSLISLHELTSFLHPLQRLYQVQSNNTPARLKQYFNESHGQANSSIVGFLQEQLATSDAHHLPLHEQIKQIHALQTIRNVLIELRSESFVAEPVLMMLPQLRFIVYGPFWIPLLVPMFRLLFEVLDSII